MVGASKLDPNWLKYNDKPIKWLINIDAEEEGAIYRSCCGNVRLTYSQEYGISNNEPNLENEYVLDIDGLIGGHSASDILTRANADFLAFAFLYKVCQSNNVQIIEFGHPKDGGSEEKFSSNQLISHCRLKFYSDISEQDIQLSLQDSLDECSYLFLGEDWNLIKQRTRITQVADDKSSFISQADSEELIHFLGCTDVDPSAEELESLYFGVFALDDDAFPIASSNIGPVTIVKNQEKDKIMFTNWTSSRSSVGSADSQEQYSINWLQTQYKKIAQEHHIECEDGPIYYPWKKDVNNPLVKVISENFKKLNVTPNIVDSPAGVEPAWWTSKSNGQIVCACIGAWLENCHSTSELLHVNSIAPVIQNIINTIEDFTK